MFERSPRTPHRSPARAGGFVRWAKMASWAPGLIILADAAPVRTGLFGARVRTSNDAAAPRPEETHEPRGPVKALIGLFVLAIRSPAPHQRYMALAGFMEGLDLRVRDGKPCAALARVQWAKRGLGGVVPGMGTNVGEDLAMQCAQQRARAGR